MVPTATIPAPDTSIRRDLGVAAMNRGGVFLQDGLLPEAVASYAEAVAVLRTLPVAENPSWANSLGAAWMNHGQLLHRAYGTVRATEALASFDSAAEVLRPFAVGENPWLRRNLAGTLLNRANLLLDLVRLAEGATAAREALALTLPHERTEPVDAELILKTRRVLCDALGQMLVAPAADQAALATEASDQVDDALALVRFWSDRDGGDFQSLTRRFFRYGTQLYRLHQPHFLAEFIEENLPLAHPELRAIALEAIDATLNDRPRAGTFLTLGDPATGLLQRTWGELESLRRRLAP